MNYRQEAAAVPDLSSRDLYRPGMGTERAYSIALVPRLQRPTGDRIYPERSRI